MLTLPKGINEGSAVANAFWSAIESGLKGTAQVASTTLDVSLKAAGATAAGTAIGAAVVGAGNAATIAAGAAGAVTIAANALPVIDELEKRSSKLSGTHQYYMPVSYGSTNGDLNAYTTTANRKLQELSQNTQANIHEIAEAMKGSGTVVISSTDKDVRSPIAAGCLHKDASRVVTRQFLGNSNKSSRSL